MFILDTDQVSLHILAIPSLELATTVITVEKQMRGRLDRIRRARTDEEIVRAYQNFLEASLFFRTITVIGFGREAHRVF